VAKISPVISIVKPTRSTISQIYFILEQLSNKINLRFRWFYYRNILRCTVIQTSKKSCNVTVGGKIKPLCSEGHKAVKTMVQLRWQHCVARRPHAIFNTSLHSKRANMERKLRAKQSAFKAMQCHAKRHGTERRLWTFS
jgi:hypothetical protein